MKLRLTISTPLYPTESEELVLAAIGSLFPALSIRKTQDAGVVQIIGEGDEENLATFHRLLREQRILDTVRAVLEASRGDNILCFQLNKQAATAGAISFPASTEPLGSIHVKIEAEDIQHVIDWLAPPTREGKPVFEIQL